jgi:serine/threonine protein kinase/tetratricopeptide (TPR) repeat protein
MSKPARPIPVPGKVSTPPVLASLETHSLELPLATKESTVVIAGKYTLVDVIGEGGMGAVWRAKQTEPVKRLVAVKLIKAGMDSKHVLARFGAERQALAMMDHPNIAKVLDGGLHEGRPFFAMELVNGVPITNYCDQRQLTPRERLELFVQVCQAIQHAHNKGIIHRDIKPSNVLITLYDEKPVVKVIDFGIAKATSGVISERTLDTAMNSVVGTPQYMSPEQATFDNFDIDTRSDIYSLGVLMYELLTGSTPFAKKDLEKKGLIEMLRVVREEEPPRPSTKVGSAPTLSELSSRRRTEPKTLTGMLRRELDWIVMKSLEKDRTRRYETATSFAADVRRYLNGEAVHAHPPSTAYRVKKFIRRNKGQVIAGSLLLLALVAGMAGTTFGLIRAERAATAEREAKVEAEQKREEAEKQRVRAEANEKKASQAVSAERLAKLDAEQKRAEADKQREAAVKLRERAESNEQKAATAERRAVEEATSSQLLAHYVNAQFMLSQGRIGPAFEAIQAAIRLRPRWEFGNFLSEIIQSARKNWRPVARFTLDAKAKLTAEFVGPDNQLLAVVNGNRLHLFNVPTTQQLHEVALDDGALRPFRIGPQHIGVIFEKSLKILAKDNLLDARTLPVDGKILTALAHPSGEFLAVLLESGETTVYLASTLTALAKKRFHLPVKQVGMLGEAGLSFNPVGKRLLFHSGLWTEQSTIWDWGKVPATEIRFGGMTNSAHFIDEHSIVEVRRWNSAAENFEIGVTETQNLADRKGRLPFASRAGGNPIGWREFLTDGSERIMCASTSADSIDFFSLTDRTMLSSTRFGSLLPHSPFQSKYLAFCPESSLLAITSSQGVTVFQRGEYSSNRAATVRTFRTNFWSFAASKAFQFTGSTYNLPNGERALNLQRLAYTGQLVNIVCNWPEAKPSRGADVWGLSVTPDGKTLAALWQENSGNGTIGSTFFRKAIVIYRLDAPRDSNGRLNPAQTIWLDKYEGINGRSNRLVVLSADAKTVVFVPANGQATIYRVADNSIVNELQLGSTMRHSPDNSLLLSGSYQEDQPVSLWSASTGKQVFQTPISGKVRTFALTQDNRKLYVGWETNELECFDVPSGKSESKIASKIAPVAISPQGDRFVGFLPDNVTNGSTVLGSLSDGQTLQVLNSGAHILNASAFDPSGGCISVCKARDTVEFFRALSLEQASQQLDRLSPFDNNTPLNAFLRFNSQIQQQLRDGATATVLPLLPKWREQALAVYADKDLEHATALATLGASLIQARAFAEAETLLRLCLRLRERNDPTSVATNSTRARLGAALLGQKNFREAELLLVRAYGALKEREEALSPPDKTLIPETLEWLIELHTTTSKPTEVSKWQAEREKYPSAKKKPLLN